MPTVRRLDSGQIEERDFQFQPNQDRTEAASFGGGQEVQQLSRTATDLARSAYRLQQEERQKADQVKLLDADTKLAQLETQLLYDPQTGAMNVSGENAFELPDTVMRSYQDGLAEIEKTLTNDEQRMSFRGMAAKRGVFIERSVNRHVGSEAKKYDDQVTTSYIANERNAALNNFENEERIAQAVNRQKGAIMSYGDRNGLPPETIKEQLLDAESKTYAGVTAKILDGGAYTHGKRYYDKFKDKMLPDDRKRVKAILDETKMRSEGQMKADSIMASTDTMGDALSAARAIEDPKLRDETVSRVKQQWADKRASERIDQEQNYETAFGIVSEQMNTDAIPVNVWSQIPPTDQKKLKDYAAKLNSGEAITTDLNAYYNLELMAGTPATKDKFLRTNLLKYRNQLSDTDFKKFADLQRTLRKDGSSQELNGITTKSQIVTGAIRAMGIDTSSRATPAELERQNQFRKAVDDQVMAFQQQNNRKINTKELREIVDVLTTEVVTGSSWIFFDETKRAFELGQNEGGLVRIDSVPESDKASISAALRRQGIQPSEDNIVKVYMEKLNQQLPNRGR